ncbi:Alpha amylase [Operophtera brumata]|uniref:alpha-glucosidase n=1 Tax=Operophtera brumata TaxID=104452 RepID=A0A0L7LPH9_OPEBR|nr:Alpha amylase [Operophtera brumata]
MNIQIQGKAYESVIGITTKLEYLKGLGVDAAWLCPIFKSPMHDFGYDISDYYTIQPDYGTMDDFEQLLKKANELNIKIILDLVINHSSNESEWFLKSSTKDEFYSDWYIWENGHLDPSGHRSPPNNWISLFRKGAWTYSSNRDQFYFHQFGETQPDFNFRSPVVVDEMKSIIKFWLEKGVAGLMINTVNLLFESDKDQYGGIYPNEPITGEPGLTPDDYGYLKHIYTRDLEDSYEMLCADSDARDVKNAVDLWMNYKPLKKPANWVKSAARSYYQVYIALTNLRMRPAFRLGRYESKALNTDVFAIKSDIVQAKLLDLAADEALVLRMVLKSSEKEKEWWETTIFYQIYPRHNFKTGIHQRPGCRSDLVIANVSITDSVWFQEALKGNEKYYNYFVWEDGIIDADGNRHPPNNWLSHFRGSAWEYREEVGKYYLHQFVVGQPDLNYRNPDVVEEMKNIIRYWLGKGVAGFRVDAVNCLFEVDKELFGGVYPDEPLSGRTDLDPESHDYLSHIYTKDRNETYYMVYEWRDVLEEFTAVDGEPRIMMTEVYAAIQDVVKYFGEGERLGAQMPFNFDLITDVDASSSAADIKRAVDKFLTYMPVDKDANWVVGNHDNSRMATRYTPALVDGINMLVLLLPGVGVTYMGEELGLVDGYVSWEDTVDPSGCNTNDPINYVKSSRDPERTPFQWNAEKNSGFSTADITWLPVAEGYETLNVEVQEASDRSHLKVYRALADLRQEDVFRYGRYESLAFNQDVFVFRSSVGTAIKLFEKQTPIETLDSEHILDLTYFENVVGDVSVVLRNIQSPKNEGDIFKAASLPVSGYEGLVRMKTLLLLPLLLLAVTAHEPELEWWETTIFYQIYPRSFKDRITESLEYLKDLGVGATWLSPIFKSPMYDFGYDIADFYAIQEEYGTMEDFEKLIAKANELDIKIVLDFVPNHTSNESVWFEEALKGHEKYFDYFVWEDPVEDENGVLHPPNNWFVIGQPDLNFRNPDVVEELKNVIRFWLGKGVAGFRVDAIAHLFEVDKELYGGKYPDEPLASSLETNPDDYGYLSHIYTTDQDETLDMVYQWREVFDEFKEKDGLSRVMMTEAYSSPQRTMMYFGEGDRKGAQMPFNFVLISDVDGSSSASDIKYALDKFLTYKPIDKSANWVAGNHDNSRVASRFSPELVDGVNMIVLLMPGVAVTYMGEEIGMVDGYVSWEDTVDPSGCNTDDPINYWTESRDPERTPFQWNSEKNAGFSSGDKTWLPVAEGYETLNVEAQSLIENSHLNVYRTLVHLRAESAFRYGRYESVALNEDVFAFRRWYDNEIYLVLINFRETSYSIDLSYFENVKYKVLLIFINSTVFTYKSTAKYHKANPAAGITFTMHKMHFLR